MLVKNQTDKINSLKKSQPPLQNWPMYIWNKLKKNLKSLLRMPES